MRVAQRMMSRNYMKQMNTTLSKRAESLERGSSGLAFKKLSDNVADGARAMHIQEERYHNTQQLNNVKDLYEEMKSVDTNMGAIHSILQSVEERCLEAMSETFGQSKRDILAKEIGNWQQEILQYANAQYSGKYLFSNAQNSSQPFTVNEENGKLMFNGVQVDQIYQDTVDRKYYYDAVKLDANGQPIQAMEADGVTPKVDADGNPVWETEKTQVPFSDEIYADVGMGLKISSDVQADPRTAFQISFSGLTLMGFGESVTGHDGTPEVASNVYDLLTQIQNALTPALDKTALDDYHRQLVELTDDVGLTRTDLGTRMTFLERTENRLEEEIKNMTELETGLVSSDPANEAMKMKECEYAWLAVLQLGSKVLPSSLLDFMS